MDESVWFIVISVLFIFLGIVFIQLGLAIWKKRKMELIICYHCDKVREENKTAYCTLAGIGVFVTGIGFILSGIGAALMKSALPFIPMTVGMAAGIALLVLAGRRYNH